MIGWSVSGVIVQIYRHQRISTAVQRQQTKWVLLGFALFPIAAFAGNLILAINPLGQAGGMAVYGRLTGITVILFGVIAVIVSIGISLLRFRLWDIDVIIRLTLVYSLLTAVLGLGYFGAVLVGQHVFGSLVGRNGQSPLTIVAITLIVAALFTPLRNRIQIAIDRRFYRQQYDREKVLSEFSSSLREEVDMLRLEQSIREVVNKTVHPNNLWLWFRPPPGDQRLSSDSLKPPAK